MKKIAVLLLLAIAACVGSPGVDDAAAPQRGFVDAPVSDAAQRPIVYPDAGSVEQ